MYFSQSFCCTFKRFKSTTVLWKVPLIQILGTDHPQAGPLMISVDMIIQPILCFNMLMTERAHMTACGNMLRFHMIPRSWLVQTFLPADMARVSSRHRLDHELGELDVEVDHVVGVEEYLLEFVSWNKDRTKVDYADD